MSRIQCVPDDVVQIAASHHENMVGTGYPYGLKKLKIHPLARLVAVADRFCDLALKSQSNIDGALPVAEILHKMHEHSGKELDPVFLKALMSVFEYPIPKDLERVSLNAA